MFSTICVFSKNSEIKVVAGATLKQLYMHHILATTCNQALFFLTSYSNLTELHSICVLSAYQNVYIGELIDGDFFVYLIRWCEYQLVTSTAKTTSI